MPDKWEQYAEAPAQDKWEKYADDSTIDYSKPVEPSNLQKLGTGVKDFTAGIGAGAISTGVGAYDLARKVPGVKRVLPETSPAVRQATQAPPSFAGQAGKAIEQTAEFFAPAGLINRGAKTIQGMRAAPAINTLGRAALEGASAAGVTGVQTGGDTRQMRNAGLTAGGVSAGLGAAGAAIRAITPTASRIYQSALKPPLGGQMGRKAPQIVETGLRERLPTSEAGHAAAGNRIDQINTQIMDGIQARADAGLTVDLKSVLNRLDDLRLRAKNSADPKGELDAINAVARDFMEGHATFGNVQPIREATEFSGFVPEGPIKKVMTSSEVPLDKAQSMKQTMGTDLRKKYGEMKAAEIEAKKQLVRGLKEEIEATFPEVKSLNRREGGLIDLEESLRRFINREGNHQMISPFTLMLGAGAATGGIASGHAAEGIGAGLFTTLLRMAIENPEIKSKIAIAARRAAQTGIPQKAADMTRSAVPKIAASATVDRQGPPKLARGGVVVPKAKRKGHWYGKPTAAMKLKNKIPKMPRVEQDGPPPFPQERS